MVKNPGDHIRAVPARLPTESPHQRLSGNLPADPMFPPVAQFDHPEVPLRQYMALLVAYRQMILGCVVLGGFLALVYSFTVTPLFTAESKIRISTYDPILASTRIEDMLQEKSKESNYFETQTEELRSYSLADKVLQDPAIKSYFQARAVSKSGVEGAAGASYQSSISQIRAYLESLSIKPVRRTSLVTIAATASDAEIAARMAERHASSYIDWVRESRIEQQSRALKFLRQQSDELREKVGDLERELADYAEANSIVAVNKDENIVVQKMSTISQMLTELSGRRLEAENMYREAQNTAGSTAGFDDTSTQTMRSELGKLEGEYRELSAKFLPSYPKMQQLQAQIAGIKNSIESQRKQIMLGLKAKFDALTEQERMLKEELEQQKSRAFELSKKQVQYNVLNRELISSRELLENVLKQTKETSLAVESNSSNVSIVDLPVVPNRASFPRKKYMVLFGVLGGLGLGIALAFTLHYIDNTIKSAEDVATYLKLPNLGVVPSFELERPTLPTPAAAPGASAPGSIAPLVPDSEQSRIPVMFMNNPTSLAAEAYRTIRTGILLSKAGEPPRIILVTSAQSGEGKTTSSVNLAASLASSGARVVIIDADLRRPTMHNHFKLDQSRPGLVDIVTGQRSFDEVAIVDLIKRISYVPAGSIPPNPAELLGSYEMLSLIEELSSRFDYVIIDSPPILPVTDSVVLSRFVDGVVLVVRAGSTPRKVLADAKDRLLSVGARMLGTVLNDVDITSGTYSYYNRYYYHSYYQSDPPADKRAPRSGQASA